GRQIRPARTRCRPTRRLPGFENEYRSCTTWCKMRAAPVRPALVWFLDGEVCRGIRREAAEHRNTRCRPDIDASVDDGGRDELVAGAEDIASAGRLVRVVELV